MMMSNKYLDDVIEELTKQMLINKFENKDNEKYIVTKHELYLFSIKLIKEIKELNYES